MFSVSDEVLPHALKGFLPYVQVDGLRNWDTAQIDTLDSNTEGVVEETEGPLISWLISLYREGIGRHGEDYLVIYHLPGPVYRAHSLFGGHPAL